MKFFRQLEKSEQLLDIGLGMMAHVFNPTTPGADAGGSL